MIRVGILVSGDLGLICLKHLSKLTSLQFCFSDVKSPLIYDFCKSNEIPLFVGNPRNKKNEVDDFLKSHTVDYIFSINYLFIVAENILDKPLKLAINLHGSLLPKYRGRTPHVWAIINDEKFTGITAHLMESKCDAGDILYQQSIKISETASGGDLLQIFKKEYKQVLDTLLVKIDEDDLSYQPQNEDLATNFERRIPADGGIDWNWQRRRIYNWIRALTTPYPGAFTFYQGNRLVIMKSEYSDLGFKQGEPNGLILRGGEQPIVKTPNGALKILEWEIVGDKELEIGQILSNVQD